MMSEKDNIRISKLLSYALRHKPAEIGITLDENGWSDVPILLDKLAQYGDPVTMPVLQHVVATNAKKRFSFNDDETKIRASQGHSVEVDLGYNQQQPPEFLYHGTVSKFIPSILRQGLQKMNRHHVHLSADVQTANIVARRRGEPVILQVNAGAMHAKGYAFYVSANSVWLTDEVPVEFIEAVK